MLEYRSAGRIDPSATLAVLLHGRGADADDMLGLERALPADWAVLAPRAPFPAAPWGYGPGRAWYRYLGEDRPEPKSFARSLEELEQFLAGLPDSLGFTPGRLVLGGFSQGGTTALAYALSRAGAPPVLNFSGFLAAHPEVNASRARALRTRVFWGHGTSDGNIPFPMAVAGREALRAGGAALEAKDYAIGHWIDPEELADAVAWVDATIGVETG